MTTADRDSAIELRDIAQHFRETDDTTFDPINLGQRLTIMAERMATLWEAAFPLSRRQSPMPALDALAPREEAGASAPVEGGALDVQTVSLEWAKIDTTALEHWRAEFGDYVANVVLGHDNVWSYRVNNTGRLGFASGDEAKAQALAALKQRLSARLIAARETVALYDAALQAQGEPVAVKRTMCVNPTAEELKQMEALLPPGSGGWIVGNGDDDRWRSWDQGNPIWVDDRAKAARYARREDAEAVHAENEAAWCVTPYAHPPASIRLTSDDPDLLARGHWFLGSMNDGLFVVDTPPRPSGTDVGPHVSDNGPTLVLNVTDLPDHKARAVVDAHNASLAPPAWRPDREAVARTIDPEAFDIQPNGRWTYPDLVRDAARELADRVLALQPEGGR